MLYAGIVFYLLTTILYFSLDSLFTLYIVRFLNGIGYGIASTATSTIVSSIIPAERRGEGINYYALSMSLAAAIGPLLGMLMQQQVSFVYIVDFCVVVLFACLVAVVYLDVQESSLTDERKAELQAFTLANFLEPRVYAISFVAFFMGICYSGVLGFLATYAQELNLLGAGTLFFVVYAVVITLARPAAGVLFDRKGEDFVMYPSYVCLSAGLLLLSVTTQSWTLLLAVFLLALVMGRLCQMDRQSA